MLRQSPLNFTINTRKMIAITDLLQRVTGFRNSIRLFNWNRLINIGSLGEILMRHSCNFVENSGTALSRDHCSRGTIGVGIDGPP